MRQMHKELGHFGICMVHLMLHGQYWWTGMYKQVVVYIGRREVCDYDMWGKLQHERRA